MAGLAIGLVKDRAALVALLVGCGSAVAAALVIDPSAAIMIGGLLGPLAGLALFRRRA
jgi:ABC-type antimicrobial peptide transport system permease subunit